MKRILAILLCTVFLAFAACSGANKPAAPSEDANSHAGETSVPITRAPATDAPEENTTEPQGEKYMNKIHATITMEDDGVIELELYPDLAPQSVRNFCYLARQGFYDGLTFHRIIPGFMIQGGDPLGNGTGGPGYCIKGEFEANGFPNDLKHTRGVISWARRSRPLDSAGSQFFIMHVDYPSLDGQYAAFGRVTSGMDVVDRIANTPTGEGNKPLTPVVIRTITVDGPELPPPDKIMD
ncbi:MAG: peptidylprolyl isomerase [Clostridia bacterium]|nr:peptidylprolyl isomerase [Clostridia bacterium]